MLLNLYPLQTGDVILETGKIELARGTGSTIHTYGHASLALGRLLYVHAPGPGDIARVEAFKLERWERDGDMIIGPQIRGRVAALRPKFTFPPENQIRPWLQWEAGFAYANLEKILEMEGLSPELIEYLNSEEGQARFQEIIEDNENPIPPTKDGRTCGELVARLLYRGDPGHTPNSLAEKLKDADVKGADSKPAVVYERGYTHLGPHSAQKKLDDILKGYDNFAAAGLWNELLKAAASNPEKAEIKKISRKLAQRLEEILERNLSIIMEAAALESEIFDAP